MGYQLLSGAAPTAIGAGSIDPALGGLDQWFVIGNAPFALHRYVGQPSWPAMGTQPKDMKWQDFVLADFDGDSVDEIIAIKQDTNAAYYLDPQVSNRFQRVTAFSPGPVMPVETGMRLWLDAADNSTIITDGSGNIQQWNDKSGANNHATQGTPAARPVLNATAMGGEPAVRFDGVDDGLVIDDVLNLGRPYTVFTVDQYYGAPQGRTLQGRDDNWLTGKWGGNNSYYAGGFVYNVAAGTNNPVIGDAVGYATSSGYMVNGVDVTQNATPTGSPGRLGLVGGGLANEQSQADVAEVIVFDRALSLHERSQVGLYLRQKYGITGYTGYNTNLATRAQVFTGADPGEGLDMQGNFLHAVNARGPGGMTVGDATFTDDTGVVTSEYEIPNWIAPDYGPSPDDDGLETVMQSIRWTATGNGGLETLGVGLPNLVPGRTYKVQMFFGDAPSTVNRHFAVDIEGSRVIGDFQEAAISGLGLEHGVVLTHEFVAGDTNLDVVLDGQPVAGGDRNPILQGITVEDRGVTGKTRINTFSGGDPGEGLRMKGVFLYAVNMRGPGGFKVGDALFTADDATPGVSVNAENEILNWIAPDYGSTANDDNLESVMQSIRWTDTNTRGETLSVDLEGLEVGHRYLLQLLFGENPSGRGFDVVVDGVLIADEFSPTAAGVSANVGVVLSHDFFAQDDVLNLVLDGYPAAFGDRNPILQGLTLAEIPEPSVSFRQACMNPFQACGIVGCQRRILWRTADEYQGDTRSSCPVGGASAAI